MFYLFFILLLFIECTVADRMAPRAFQGCVLNINEIHCYGGFTHQPVENVMQYTNASNDHFYLSVDSLDFATLSSSNVEQQSQWQYVARPARRTVLPALASMAMTAIASQTQFVLYGGVTEPTSQTLTTTLWKCSTNFNNSMSSPPSQKFYTIYSPVVDTRASTIWTWGGLINTTDTAATNAASTFDYSKEKWNTVAGDPTNGNVWIKHTAVFIEKTGRIYMMGGYEVQPGMASSTGKLNDMTHIRWFDTNNNAWGMDQAKVNGNQPITSRTLHTVTSIPGSNKLLVYGGYNDQDAKLCQDYAYVYDFIAKEYTPINFNHTGPGPRASHSAVGYNSYIMIMFGIDSGLGLQQDLNALDVSDPNHITWTSATSPTDPSDDDNNNNGQGGSRLSVGGTIGVAIGAAVVLIGIVAGIIYYMYRKRQQRQQFQLETMDPRAANGFHGYDALQKPTLEDDDNEDNGNQPAYRMSTNSTPVGPQSDQSTSTMVASQTVSPFKVKPSDDIMTTHGEDPGVELPTLPPHTFSYEVADRNDSHTSIKPHDAKI